MLRGICRKWTVHLHFLLPLQHKARLSVAIMHRWSHLETLHFQCNDLKTFSTSNLFCLIEIKPGPVWNVGSLQGNANSDQRLLRFFFFSHILIFYMKVILLSGHPCDTSAPFFCPMPHDTFCNQIKCLKSCYLSQKSELSGLKMKNSICGAERRTFGARSSSLLQASLQTSLPSHNLTVNCQRVRCFVVVVATRGLNHKASQICPGNVPVIWLQLTSITLDGPATLGSTQVCPVLLSARA